MKIYDCRFPFEYNAGHILGAQNMYLPSQALKTLFDPMSLPKSERGSKKRTILILHCEFSTLRAPDMASFIRRLDRKINVYPELCYPQIFLLEGGYNEVYTKHANSHPFLFSSNDGKNNFGYVKQMDLKFTSEETKFLNKLNEEKRDRNGDKLNNYAAKINRLKLLAKRENERKAVDLKVTPHQEEVGYSVAANTRSKLRSHRPYKVYVCSTNDRND